LCSLTFSVFASLGLDPNTTSLLATGVYGIVNTVCKYTLAIVILPISANV
jgi:hypothetical protein